VKKTN